jgi:hypothetical protein
MSLSVVEGQIAEVKEKSEEIKSLINDTINASTTGMTGDELRPELRELHSEIRLLVKNIHESIRQVIKDINGALPKNGTLRATSTN